jgi:uncharacterized membrane protein YjgN (DUF898 family)
MELITKLPKSLKFHGSGSTLFGLLIVNFLLTVITLGMYYPWAKAKRLKYLYAETEFDSSRFAYHGTGIEMFKGFIKAIGIFALIYALFILSVLTNNLAMRIVGFIFLITMFLIIAPLAIHGSMKYRMSRTSWRGIHFGYRGDRAELIKLYLRGTFLTIITLYIYLAWFVCDLRHYIISHIRFGSISFSYKGKGIDLFLLNLKGFFLTLFTLGIYSFWWFKDIIKFYIANISIIKDGQEYDVKFKGSAGDIFLLFLINYFLVIFTLGIAIPWVMVRNIRFIYENSLIDGELDTDKIQQTETEYKDATGDDMLDMLDLNII